MRAALGRWYARSVYPRIAPRSARTAPRLPAQPLSRRYGLDRGRPVDRVYIERFVAQHAADIKGRVLEVYEDTYTTRFGAGVTTSDVLDVEQTPRATVVGDLETGAGLAEASYDCLIVTQTLQLVWDLHACVKTMAWMLAPGGVLLLSVPGISQRSEIGEQGFPDLWRFTRASVDRLLGEPFATVDAQAHGNVATSAAFLYGMAEEELAAATFAGNDPEYELVVTARAVR